VLFRFTTTRKKTALQLIDATATSLSACKSDDNRRTTPPISPAGCASLRSCHLYALARAPLSVRYLSHTLACLLARASLTCCHAHAHSAPLEWSMAERILLHRGIKYLPTRLSWPCPALRNHAHAVCVFASGGSVRRAHAVVVVELTLSKNAVT